MIDTAVAPPAASTPSPAPPRSGVPTAAPPPGVHRLANGTELIGEFQDSGLTEPRFLVRRSDGQVMQLPLLLYRVAASLDGRRDDAGVAGDLARELGRPLTGEEVAFLVEDRLRPAGIIASDVQEGVAQRAPVPVRADPLLALRYRVGVIPASVAWRIGGVFRPFFWRPVWVVVLAAFVVTDLAIVLRGDFLGRTLSGVNQIVQQPSLTLVIMAATLLALAFHECGHVTACRYGGARPGDMGIGLYLVWPALYSTVTDAYRLDRTGRLRTDLGGVYFNVVAIVGTSAVYLATGQPWLLVLLLAMHTETAWQFLPSIRLDGYYMLADLVGVPELFGYLSPVLKSLLPGRPTHPRVRALKPWSRRIIVCWVVAVVPTITFYVGTFLLVLPQALPALWSSMQQYLHQLQQSVRAGDVAMTVLGILQLFLILLPWVGTALIAWSTARMLGRLALRRWGRGPVAPARVAAVRQALGVATVTALAAGLVLRVAAVAATLPATTDERVLTDGALAAVRSIAGPPLRLADVVLHEHLLVFGAVSGGFVGSGEAVAGARGLVVVATAVLAAVLVVLVASRRLAPLSVAVPMAAVAVMGPMVTALATLRPGVVAAGWVVIGGLLLAQRSRATLATGAVAVAVALAAEPLLAVPAAVYLAGAVHLSSGHGAAQHRPRHAAPAPHVPHGRGTGWFHGRGTGWLHLAWLLLAAAGGVALTASRGALPLAGPDRTVLLVLSAWLVGVGFLVRTLRPHASALAALVGLSALPWRGAGDALVLDVLGVVVLGVFLVERVVRRPAAERPHPLVRAAVMVPVVLLTAVGALFLPRSGEPLPHQALATWLQGPTALGGRAAVPAALWGDLVHDGVPPDRLLRGDAGSGQQAQWIVEEGPHGDGAPPRAEFGSGSAALTVWESPAAGQSEARKRAAEDQQRQRAARAAGDQALGETLVRSPRVSGNPDVLDALRRGAVDRRAMSVLFALIEQYDVSLADPGSQPATGSAAPALLITAVDGRPADRPGTAGPLTRWLNSQPSDMAPASIVPGPGGLVLTWAPESPAPSH